MTTKLDMTQAWNSALALLSGSKDMVVILAGVFFFLPNMVVGILMPVTPDAQAPEAPDPQTLEEALEQMTEQLSALFGDIWWMFLVVLAVQAVGTLALLALLANRARPTVGEAVGFGLTALIPYLASQIILMLAIVAAFTALISVGTVINPALGALGALLGFVVAAYLWTKTSLVAAVMATEGQLNPIAALKRSWQVTKGNSLRLFAFYLLLGLAAGVLVVVIGMVLGLSALMGDTVSTIVSALGNSLVTMVYAVVSMAVLASIYRQLSGGLGHDVDKVFD